jgi:hypothetical protein
MENSIALTPEPTAKCDACYTDVLNDDAFCANCGYPVKGTEFEQKTFVANQQVLHIDMAEYNDKIKKAGNSLYYLSGIFLLNALFVFFTNKDSEDVLGVTLPIIILSILFLGLGGYSRKKPLACIICGLSLYVIVQVLNLIVDPVSLFRGIIFKVIIIGYLIKGIKSALELENFKKENNIA